MKTEQTEKKKRDREERRLNNEALRAGRLAGIRCRGCGGLVSMPCRLCAVRGAR